MLNVTLLSYNTTTNIILFLDQLQSITLSIEKFVMDLVVTL
jgi:hypothetical protein